MTLIPSLDAHKHLKATMTACSWRSGWRSLLLRAYDDPSTVEEFTTPATADHLLVLVTGGSCEVEARYKGGWNKASHRAGSLGMTAPGQKASLRWHGQTRHQTLQLHLPSATLKSALEDISGRDASSYAMPSDLSIQDPLITNVMMALADAMANGVPDLYAETAAQFLATHLVMRVAEIGPRSSPKDEPQRLKRVEELMRENFNEELSLNAMAQEAGVSRFHFLRLFKETYGETPFRRLTRLRMEEAQRRLLQGKQSITDIALACGYNNPAHFTTAFRRVVGTSPQDFRRQC